MARNLLTNIRNPPPIPANYSQLSWAVVARPTHEFLLWLLKYIRSIPGGFKDLPATEIHADDTADGGTETTGWAASDHVHSIETGTPTPLGLGQAGQTGTGSALVRADGEPNTIGLSQQIRLLVFYGLG